MSVDGSSDTVRVTQRPPIARPGMAANIPPPSPMSCAGDWSVNWEIFRAEFEDYILVTGLADRTGDVQAAMLRTVMGSECRHVYRHNLNLTDVQRNDPKAILDALEQYFKPAKNVIYERYVFGRCTQEDGESIDNFVTRLREKAATCDYGQLRDEMIRDKIVLGITDESTRRRLLREKTLTLASAIEMCRAAEQTDMRMKVMECAPRSEAVHAVARQRFRPSNSKQSAPTPATEIFHSNMKSKEEEGLDDQERNSSLGQEDPEPPQIKEEREELCTSHEGEQLILKQETEGVIVWTGEDCLKQLDTIWESEIKPHGIDLPQQSDCKEEEFPTDKQVCNEEKKFSLDQEDPDLPQFKEEQEDLYTSQKGEHLLLKQETETFMVTPTYEQNDHSEPEPKRDQLLSHSSSEPESQGQERNEDSGLTRNVELKKRKHDINRSHSSTDDNSSVSESQCKTDTNKKCLTCDTCGKTFHDNYSLTRHLKVHTGEKPYSCTTCGKRFSELSSMNRHMRIHTGEKPHSCITCGKRFCNLSTFKNHTRFHTGERPYSCGTCGRRFSHMVNLKAHVRIHTGEKPYSCNICEKRFSYMTQLKRHLRIHSG